MTQDEADVILAGLPAELRMSDIARVLGVKESRVVKMRGANRLPREDFIANPKRAPVWRLDSLRGWLRDRLMNREAELAAARVAGKDPLTGRCPLRRDINPLWPFFGIGD